MQPHFHSSWRELDPFLDDAQAHALVKLCEDFGEYGLYPEEDLDDDIGDGLPQRFDAASEVLRTGGRFTRKESLAVLAARTHSSRETYAYGEEILVDESVEFPAPTPGG